ncbi:MAG: aminopeptidase P N-terminal domain-containing protein, partial [Myxococcota bacterium]|nr:aminopeptidase P N-terminal domain-containing protein [Myxococcota bacterium]
SEYRYRQDSDVYYLSGWRDPDVAVLLRPGHEQPFTLFVQPRNPAVEMWTGRRPGPEGAMAEFGADWALDIDELPIQLPALVQGYANLHYRLGEDQDRDRLVVGALSKARRQAKKNGLVYPDAFIDPARVLHELRLFKSEAEIQRLRVAAEITSDAHCEAMRMTRGGVFEYQLEACIERVFRARGGEGPGYTTIVGGGNNATVLHYSANREVLAEGTLVCVDAGCEFDFYTADLTRTWPVSGTYSPAQRALYEVVLDAQLKAIDCVRPGNTFHSVHEMATRVLTEGLVDLGLLEGDVDTLIADGAQKRWYPHGTGHWLGLDVHDVGAYYQSGESRFLEPGMVLTVEPGIYVPSDAEDAPREFRGIGIRIEDDVLVTDGDPDVLTSGAPKLP